MNTKYPKGFWETYLLLIKEFTERQAYMLAMAIHRKGR